MYIFNQIFDISFSWQNESVKLDILKLNDTVNNEIGFISDFSIAE